MILYTRIDILSWMHTTVFVVCHMAVWLVVKIAKVVLNIVRIVKFVKTVVKAVRSSRLSRSSLRSSGAILMILHRQDHLEILREGAVAIP